MLEGMGVGRRLPPAFFQCPICKIEAVFKPDSKKPVGAVTTEKTSSTESTLKRMRLQQHSSRGDRIRQRDARKMESVLLLPPIEGKGQSEQRAGECQVEGQQESFLTPGDLGSDSEDFRNIGGVGAGRIASQSTGSSETSHEAETVMGDGYDEDDEEAEDGEGGGEEGGGSLTDRGLAGSAEGMSLSLGECGGDGDGLSGAAACAEEEPSVFPRDGWTASSLPRSRLSDFIEAMVGDRLRQRGEKDLMDTLTIRMVSNCMHNFEVPGVITNNLPTADGKRVQQYMLFKQKCILLFQKIDGVDVCLFCLYVQEFDDRCPEPNKSKVYIAYLDSVEYFRPRALRTIVYHEILVAYLKWSQARGFKQGHIWACPPQRGDNFIFWCHPPQQRTPSRDRLNGWYNTMLSRACGLGILSAVETLWASYFSAYGKRDETSVRTASRNSFVSKNSVALAARRATSGKAEGSSNSATAAIPMPVCPPVFEGDFWVNECSRVYKLVQMRAKDLEGQDRPVNQRRCREILKQMMSKPMAVAFNQPVDPVLLHIPDYPLIITRPMDLGTVRDTLRTNGYRTILDFANVCAVCVYWLMPVTCHAVCALTLSRRTSV